MRGGRRCTKMSSRGSTSAWPRAKCRPIARVPTPLSVSLAVSPSFSPVVGLSFCRLSLSACAYACRCQPWERPPDYLPTAFYQAQQQRKHAAWHAHNLEQSLRSPACRATEALDALHESTLYRSPLRSQARLLSAPLFPQGASASSPPPRSRRPLAFHSALPPLNIRVVSNVCTQAQVLRHSLGRPLHRSPSLPAPRPSGRHGASTTSPSNLGRSLRSTHPCAAALIPPPIAPATQAQRAAWGPCDHPAERSAMPGLPACRYGTLPLGTEPLSPPSLASRARKPSVVLSTAQVCAWLQHARPEPIPLSSMWYGKFATRDRSHWTPAPCERVRLTQVRAKLSASSATPEPHVPDTAPLLPKLTTALASAVSEASRHMLEPPPRALPLPTAQCPESYLAAGSMATTLAGSSERPPPCTPLLPLRSHAVLPLRIS